jgi:CheY-like chemotaxis protein
MKILVVDDNRDLADVIKNVLEGEGMHVVAANNSREGYSAYLLFKPDLIITDIQMPGETGLEMMGHIRTHDPMIKTVYMSGDIDAYRPYLEREKKRYPVTYVRKPFSLQSLAKMVSEPAAALP